MRERGKGIEAFSNGFSFSEFSNSTGCRKHPNSSSVGICADCLKDKLVKLVCSECGEQRLSSCSCSDVSSSYRNSCSTAEVGRVSFLIENEKNDQNPKANRGGERSDSEQVIFLRRSRSSCVEVKKSNGLWRIKRLFRKRRNKRRGQNGDVLDGKSEIWVSDAMGISRSRSLCSFRGGGGGHNDLDGGSECRLSSAKISDVTSGFFLDSDKPFGFFNEPVPRRSGFRAMFEGENGGRRRIEFDRTYSVPNRSVFPAKESDFNAIDESAFIDLKLDLAAESKEVCGGRISCASDNGGDCRIEGFDSGGSFANWKSSGGSCRITANDRGLKRWGRNHKVWKWIFKYNNPANKNEEK